MNEWYPIFLMFAFGLCIGSFMNVVICRMPEAQSIVHPRSRCPSCSQMIHGYDNIPVISYLLLRGRCRYCKTPISLRYPVVEILTGMLAVGCYRNFGYTTATVVYFVFAAVLLVVTYIDLDHQIIPDRITLPGIPIFFAASLLIPTASPADSLLGLLLGGGSLLAVALGYQLISGRPGMGMGDVKLLAMIGTIVGWRGVLFTIFASSAAGTAAGIPLMLLQKKDMKLAIPFGPFLALGAILYVFFGEPLIRWYQTLV
jgi:leader peptidase (prepilin peptidase)/N-methyltransferase